MSAINKNGRNVTKHPPQRAGYLFRASELGASPMMGALIVFSGMASLAAVVAVALWVDRKRPAGDL